MIYTNLDKLDEDRVSALECVNAQKNVVTNAYNRHVRLKQFGVSDLVWKNILPKNSDKERFDTWSSIGEGPYLVTDMLSGNAY